MRSDRAATSIAVMEAQEQRYGVDMVSTCALVTNCDFVMTYVVCTRRWLTFDTYTACFYTSTAAWYFHAVVDARFVRFRFHYVR